MNQQIYHKFVDSNLSIISESNLINYIFFCLEKSQEKHEKFKTEYHHILPKSLFPEFSNLKEHRWNGVFLLKKDHCEAHGLLTKSILSDKMDFCFYSMYNKFNFLFSENDDISMLAKISAEKLSEKQRGMVSCFDKNKNYCLVQKDEFNKRDELMGVASFNSSEKNSSCKRIRVYNHKDELVFDEKYNVTKKLKALGFPNISLAISWKNEGLILGHTNQSRIELRKTMKQSFIGWYALRNDETKKKQMIDFDIEKEQTIGLYCKLPIARTTLKNTLSQEKMKNIFLECIDGQERSMHEIRNIKGSITKQINGRWYKVLNFKEIIFDIINHKDLVGIHPKIYKSTKDNPFMINSKNTNKNKLKEKNIEFLIGCFVEEIELSLEEKEKYLTFEYKKLSLF